MITEDILDRLYSPSVVKSVWADVQANIKKLDWDLTAWQRHLPSELNFTIIQQDGQHSRDRTALGLFYYSSKMILHRPCLCRLDGRILNESNQSKDFNRSAAATCIQSAQSLLNLLPQLIDHVELYRTCPWWSILHHLCQAAAILILELGFRANHMPNQAEEILRDAKTTILWLHALGEESISASRSWEVYNRLLHDAAPRVGGNTDDMPPTAPIPPDLQMYTQSQQMLISEPDWISPDRDVPFGYYGHIGPFPLHHPYARYDEFGPLQVNQQSNVITSGVDPSTFQSYVQSYGQVPREGEGGDYQGGGMEEYH
jgi:hypothetical protein